MTLRPAQHWHLPGLAEEAGWKAERWFAGRTPAGHEFRTPHLSAPASAAVTDEVRRAALAARHERTLEVVVRTASRAACRLANGSDPFGEEARSLLAEESGWDESTAAETLAAMAETWTESALWRVIRDELADPGVLDGFRPAGGTRRSRRRRASGPPLLLQVMAGNVPGVAVTAALRGLIVRSGVLCKTPQGEPGLLPLFARGLAEADTGLGACVAATWWPTEDPPALWNLWVKRSGKVVVYGGAETIEAVRAQVPAGTDVIAYGPKLGIGIVLPDGVEAETTAVALARDVCAYDQQGCVSPRLVYVVGDAYGFADRLATALEAEVDRLGRPAPLPEEAVEIRLLRAEAEWGSGRRVIGSEGDLAWTILVEEVPGIQSEGLPRVVRLCALDRVEELADVLAPLEGHIQSIGYAGGKSLDVLAHQAADLGVSRLAPLGTVAWPPADWRHDGRHQLLPLLSWTDWEPPTPRSASS